MGLLKKDKNKSSSKGLDLLIMGSILLIFFLSPIFFTGLVGQGVGFEKLILFYFLVLLGLVAWVIKGMIRGELKIKRTPLDLPIMAILVIFGLSTLLSVSTKDSLIGSYGNPAKSFVALIVFILFYYLVVNNLNTARIKAIFWTLVGSVSLLVVFSFLQLKEIFIIPLEFTQRIGFNMFGSFSSLTMFLVVIMPLLVVAAAQTREIAPKMNKAASIVIKLLLSAVIALLFVVLTFLNGFTFWLVAVVGIVIVLMFFLAKIIKTENVMIPLLVFGATIILLVIGNFDFLGLDLPAEVSLSRGASWNITKSAIAENPVFGSGPSTFYYDFSKFKSLNFNNTSLWNIRFESATGILFELLATVGVLGAIAVVIMGLIALSVAFITLIKNEKEELNSILLGLFASFVSLSLYALLFSQSSVLILMNILLGVFTVSTAVLLYPEKFKTLTLSFRSSAKYALALAAIVLCVSAGVVILFTMGIKMYWADMYAKEAMLASSHAKKIELLTKSIALAPYQDAYYIELAKSYMSLANQAALKKNDTSVGTNLSLAIERGRKAVDLVGHKAYNNESLALIYENASFYTRGALEWSENLYKKVTELDPHNPVPYLRIALINMTRANMETDNDEKEYYISEAVKYYDDAIKKKPDLAAAYYGKAIASEKLGDSDEAIEQLKRANLLSRNNLDYRFELGRLFFNRGVKQLSLEQTDTKRLTESEVVAGPDEEGEEGEGGEELSVRPTQASGPTVTRNDDLTTAEQLFWSIVSVRPNHANARYSLAVLYKKIGDLDKAREMVDSLYTIIKDAQTQQALNQQFADLY